MIRKGNYAKYKGLEYHLTREMESNRIKIYTKNKEKTDATFVQCNLPGEQERYRKYVQLWELEDTYSVYTFVVEGENKKMIIEKESEDMYYVFAEAEDQDLIEKYHLTEVDRGIFGGWISKIGVQLVEKQKHVSY
ncbi:MAG: hypothetical protein K2K70_06315 [Lachnospiraceae bacterium]|nr:hypothetical protein [Lachnospiraceae bacterium]